MPSDCQRQITFRILFIKISEKLSTLWYSVPKKQNYNNNYRRRRSMITDKKRKKTSRYNEEEDE